MGLFLFRFWPALLPLLLYVLWYLVVRHKAVMAQKDIPHFRSGPVYWMIIATLLIAAACFVTLALTQSQVRGVYIPPHMEHGVLVPGEVKEGAEKTKP